jgi:uncharacterized membrane protein YccC
MAFYGDPAALERLARQIRDHAREVRERAVRATAAAQAAQWHSVARERFISEVEDRARRLERAAGQLEEAADRLDEQARAVRDRLDEIRAAQVAVIGWVLEATAEVERAAARGLSSVAVAGVELSSGRVPGSAGLRLPELPAPGHLGWLEVAGSLRRGGIRL